MTLAFRTSCLRKLVFEFILFEARYQNTASCNNSTFKCQDNYYGGLRSPDV